MTIAIPRISIKTEINASKAPAFVGRITLDELRPGKFEGTPYQWVIAVKPLAFPTKNLGFQNYISIKDKNLQGEISANSALGMHMSAFKKVFPELEFNLGEGDLLDQIAFFERYEHEYPPAKNGEVYRAQMLVPTRLATAEELEALGLEAPRAAGDVTYTTEQIAKMLAALSGKKQPAFQKAVFAAKLDPESIKGVVSGEAIDYLVNNGYVTFDEDGILVPFSTPRPPIVVAAS